MWSSSSEKLLDFPKQLAWEETQSTWSEKVELMADVGDVRVPFVMSQEADFQSVRAKVTPFSSFLVN